MLTGYPIQFNKAVVGRNAFAHESGIHQHGVLKNRETYEIMDPSDVGQESQLVLGKHSGRAAFAAALAEMNVTLAEPEFGRAFERFKELADRKGEIGEAGLRAIVEIETEKSTDKVQLVGLHLSGGDRETPVATVRVSRGEHEFELTAEGDGMVNAAFVALQDAFGIPATLLDYRVNPFTSGADAMAEVNVIIQIGPITYSGRGVSTDVVEGSARAFVSALNKALADQDGSTVSDDA
jgi:2-isopropylmalate synthase